MSVSAHNVYNIFRGVITQIDTTPEGAEVTVEIAPGIVITSMIAKTDVRKMQQGIGQAACAVIESVDVMLAID